MQKKLKEIFTEEIIQYYKENKKEISQDLLFELRSFGNEGKKIALEILDFEKDHEQYYLDAYGNRMSFNGNRRLKKSFTKLSLSDIHKKELEKCQEDIHYFKDNYIKIKTKAGINFPETREYQDNFLDVLTNDDIEDIVTLQGRQCCTSGTMIKIINNSKIESKTFGELFNECKNEYKR
jgi:hypothetical protein